jgi:hypothetical protein
VVAARVRLETIDVEAKEKGAGGDDVEAKDEGVCGDEGEAGEEGAGGHEGVRL